MNNMTNRIRSLQYPSEQERRKNMLDMPHMKPLTDHVEWIRESHNGVPWFDPCDGGIEAKALFLLQDPGPKAVKSGFISRNNNDPSAENQFRFQKTAGLDREDTLLWNIVPWRVKRVVAKDRDDALPYLEKLIALLPQLKVIILSGNEAWKCHSKVRTITDMHILETYHTGNRGLNSQGRREEFIESVIQCYREVAEIISVK